MKFELHSNFSSPKLGKEEQDARRPARSTEPFSRSQLRRRTHARTRSRRPVKQPERPNGHQNLPKNKSTGSLPPPSPQYITAGLLLLVTSPRPSPSSPSTSRRTSSPRGPATCGLPFRVRGRHLPPLRQQRGRRDVAVPAAVLPAAARRAGRDLPQHPRCVHFLASLPNDPAVSAGRRCENPAARARLLACGPVRRGFLGSNALPARGI